MPDEKTNIGIIRELKTQFVLKDGNISNIIKNALIEKGYDLEIEPLEDKNHFACGENIKVFEVYINERR